MASILNLPDELLDKIICAAAPIIRHQELDHTQVYHGLSSSLLLVCRRFHRIAMPYLYADLEVYSGWRRVITHLHCSCRENPWLWTLCRSLTVHYQESLESLLYAVTDFITWFTTIKVFTLNGFYESERPWELLHLAIKHMSCLTRLTLKSGFHSHNLDLLRVIDVLGDFGPPSIHNLQTLELGALSTHEDRLCQTELEGKEGVAPFTKLRLSSFLLTPETLEALVRWPRSLKRLDLHFSSVDNYDSSTLGLYREWSLATLQPILDIHRKTLRSINIYGLKKGRLAGFDLRDFESLEELSLSSACIGYQFTTDNKISLTNLIAPRLRVFHFSCKDRQYREGMSAFDQREEDWLRVLAREALARGWPLQRIEITFAPLLPDNVRKVYPWDRMDNLKADLRPYGIKVCYDPPLISREEYEDAVHMAELRDPRSV